MCIGIPGKITHWSNNQPDLAAVDVCGIAREVNITFVRQELGENPINQWVLVHVGFAMSIMNEEEAEQTLDLLKQMGELEPDVTAFLSGGYDAVH